VSRQLFEGTYARWLLHRILDATSAADELAKWAALRDSGVISAEEFEAKKRQLLGL
jgi:hypothetical protein